MQDDANELTITLELRLEVESLTGRPTADDGTVRPFAGWLGLLAALDACCPTCASAVRGGLAADAAAPTRTASEDSPCTR